MNSLEDSLFDAGWPSSIIDEIKKIFTVDNLGRFSHVDYHYFNSYMNKYPFLDLESAVRIFMSGLQYLDLNIFQNYIGVFINLLKQGKENLIYKAVDFIQEGVPLNEIFPIIENLNEEDLLKLERFYKYIIFYSGEGAPYLNIKYVLSALKNISSNDILIFVMFLISNDFKLRETFNMFKKLGASRVNAFMSLKESLNIDDEILIEILSEIPHKNIEKGNRLLIYIKNIEDLQTIYNNIEKISSIKELENIIGDDVFLNMQKFMIYFNLIAKYSSYRPDVYISLKRLNKISYNNLNSFESYDKYLSNFDDEQIHKANTIFAYNSSLSIDNYFELLENVPITDNFLNKINNIRGCSRISIEEAEYLNESDVDTLYKIIYPFFEVFRQFNLPFSDLLFAQQSLKLSVDNNKNIFETIRNIMNTSNINFKQALKLYNEGFNSHYKTNIIRGNLNVSVDEFKAIYYMIDKIAREEIHHFFNYLKQDIDLFDAIELAILKNKEIDEETKLDKNWYYLKITEPIIFGNMKQTEENLRDTAILYEYLIKDYKSSPPYYNFIALRDIYFDNDISIYDFIESYYQYVESNLDYSFSIFLNEKYNLKPEDLIEKIKIIDRNVIDKNKDIEYLSFTSEKFLYKEWGDPEKLINTLYRYASNNNFNKSHFDVLFKNPILIGMNSNQIKNILELTKRVNSFDEELIKDIIKAHSIFKNPDILSKYKPHDLAQNIPSNLPYYELKGLDIFLIKYIKYKNPKVKSVSYNWNKIPNNLKLKNDVNEMFNYLVDSKIIDKTKSLISSECDTWNISDKKFEKVEQIFSESLRNPMPKWSKIPVIKGESGFSGRFLPRDDPRGLFIGNYTDCCQKIEGAGEVVAIHSQTSPYSAVFVIEYKNNIIAQSWVFNDENKNIIFDNIEKDFSSLEHIDVKKLLEIIVDIYKKAASEIKRLGYQNILLGANQYGITPQDYANTGLQPVEGFRNIVAPDYENLFYEYQPDSMGYKLRLAMVLNKIDKKAPDISDIIENFIRGFK